MDQNEQELVENDAAKDWSVTVIDFQRADGQRGGIEFSCIVVAASLPAAGVPAACPLRVDQCVADRTIP